jgi:hypothetical protein
VLDREAGDYRVTLDGNEQYEDVEGIAELWRRMAETPALRRLVAATLYIEQPLKRSVALSRSVEALARERPLIIDESDGEVSAFPTALALGYTGVSSKLCKGLYKSILNAARAAMLNRDAERPRAFLSGEDLTVWPGVALQQDTALVSLLGLDHVERNAHHFIDGMSFAPASEQDAFLAAHPALYERPPFRPRAAAHPRRPHRHRLPHLPRLCRRCAARVRRHAADAGSPKRTYRRPRTPRSSRMKLPTRFGSVEELEDFMTEPTPELVADLAQAPGDILILGVAGKMGPTLARMAKRAAPERRVIGVARFSDPRSRRVLEAAGVETIPCDLLDRDALAALPRCPNVVFMAGMKFGSTGQQPLTWAMNVQVPAMVAETFAASRIVAFSTGCVYPFVPVDSGGASEDMEAVPPPGDYAYSCLGRERMFQHFSNRHGTPGTADPAQLRHRHALRRAPRRGPQGPRRRAPRSLHGPCERDLAGATPMRRPCAACAMPLRPRAPLNVTGPETMRSAARATGARRRTRASSSAREPVAGSTTRPHDADWLSPRALLTMIEWTADWLTRHADLNKPTHYEVRDGRY